MMPSDHLTVKVTDELARNVRLRPSSVLYIKVIAISMTLFAPIWILVEDHAFCPSLPF
ncbi:hypothetical protein BDZ89DRAFT_503397 [Hymenopellis radicata]|nr:hypothetical protein BDZ89DRAFT_503397 [Hymenopellis radicata]